MAAPPCFDARKPALYYQRHEDMMGLADAVIVADGHRLPVHSQVLSQHSGVLRGLFIDFLGPGRKRKADGEEALVLEAGVVFAGASLHEIACFLRMCYMESVHVRYSCDDDAVFGGLLRLAHKLDAPDIQAKVLTVMRNPCLAQPLAHIVEWAAAADDCGLTEESVRILSQGAKNLVSCRDEAHTMAEVGQIVDEDGKYLHVLPRLLGIVASYAVKMRAAARPRHLVTTAWPTVPCMMTALERAAGCTLEWTIPDFSGVMDDSLLLESPGMWAQGHEWAFELCADGEDDTVSISLMSKDLRMVGRASATISVVDQGAAEPEHLCILDHAVQNDMLKFGRRGQRLAFSRLQARPGYLEGDQLVVRASVNVQSARV